LMAWIPPVWKATMSTPPSLERECCSVEAKRMSVN
jgi:hypothetical protein